MATDYNLRDVKCIYGGALLSGYGDGDAIRIEYNADLFTLQVGADGEAARSKSNNRSARITIRCMVGSAANAILQAALTADQAANAGAAPLSIFDPATLTNHTARGAWVTRPPTKVYAADAQALEWVLETDELIGFVGAEARGTA